MDYILLAITWYVVLLISMTFHEAAHSFAAMKLGDPTAYHHGQVSLNPVPHIKRAPFGMVVVPIVSFLLAGWMVGWASTPYNLYWAQQHKRQAALMALAGPAANLFLLLAAAMAIRCGMLLGLFLPPQTVTFNQITAATSSGLANSAAVMISILFSFNLILLLFNLIPMPPLDGSKVLASFLTDEAQQRYNSIMSQPIYMVIGLAIAWKILGLILSPIHTIALNMLYPGLGYH